MGIEKRDELIEHPTFLEHIRYFFDARDVDHMWRVARIDLATYEGVKEKASQIYFQTSGGTMPPPEDKRPWPATRIRTFRNWIIDKFPMGIVPLDPSMLAITALAAGPVPRRNCANLPAADVELLATAFSGLMDRDPSDPQSYFSIAGLHWFPEPFWCVHHEPRYNPWHRLYVDRFEAALRSVPGCDGMRLPYWDVLAPAPEWLFLPPFDHYVLQEAAGPEYAAGYATTRNDRDTIARGIDFYEVPRLISEAMNAPDLPAN